MSAQTHDHSSHPSVPSHDHRVVHVDVVPLGGLDAIRFTFPEAILVREAAATAARDLGYTAQHPGFQNAQKVQLQQEETLVAAGVNDNYVLYLNDTAGGQ